MEQAPVGCGGMRPPPPTCPPPLPHGHQPGPHGPHAPAHHCPVAEASWVDLSWCPVYAHGTLLTLLPEPPHLRALTLFLSLPVGS